MDEESLSVALMEIIESWVDIDEVYDELYSSIKQYISIHCTGKEE